MNIFVLSKDVTEAAVMHCDKHVVKMILETAQVLSAVHHRYGTAGSIEGIYKETHKNHPCTLWAGDSAYHYIWLYNLGMALCKEYTYRYNKVHKTQAVLERLSTFPVNIPNDVDVPQPQCMPDDCKVEGDVVAAYHNYYRKYKHAMCKWKNRPVPAFMEGIICGNTELETKSIT